MALLWANKNELLNSKVRLKTLKINSNYDELPLESISEFIHQLYDRELFKCLHIYSNGYNNEFLEKFASFEAFESLEIVDYNNDFNLSLIKNVKYLKLNDYKFANDVVFKPTELKNLVFGYADFNFVSLLVRELVNLKIIQINAYAAYSPINLSKLNNERG